MIEQIEIVKNTCEHCPQAFKPVMTLYFKGKPTVKQIIHVAKHMKKAYREKPDFDSPNLRIYSAPSDGLNRIQVVS